jgi:hypothetical protein
MLKTDCAVLSGVPSCKGSGGGGAEGALYVFTLKGLLAYQGSKVDTALADGASEKSGDRRDIEGDCSLLIVSNIALASSKNGLKSKSISIGSISCPNLFPGSTLDRV